MRDGWKFKLRLFWSRNSAPIMVFTLAAVLLLIGVWFGYAESKLDGAQKAAFMEGCLRHEKQYKCTAMWRAGQSRQPTYIPSAPIIINPSSGG